MMQQVNVRVPASTSNLGPGFDCLGVALRIYNTVTVARANERQRHPGIVNEAARAFFQGAGRKPFQFSASLRGDVPHSRGLGSSVTVRLGILHGLNELSRRPLDKMSIFRLCAKLEGHPDNAAPGAFGGFTIAKPENVRRFEVSPRLRFVLLIPDFEIATAKARKILPEKVSLETAVTNCRNVCQIAAAFASGEYENLRGTFADGLHQPFRTKLIPFLPRVITAAEKAGALGAYLSGSGSTICAVTLKNEKRISAAMLRAAKSKAQIVITTTDNSGVKVGLR